MIKTEQKVVTPAIAKNMLKRNHGNRKVSEGHVAFLSKEMRNGNWVFDGQPIRFTAEGRLLDGQHRLSAIVHSGKAQSMLIIRGVDPEAFKVMDTGKNRSTADVFGIHGVDYASHVAACCRMVMRLEVGKSSHEGGNSKTSNTEVLDFFNENPAILDHVRNCKKLYLQFNKVLTLSQIAGFRYMMSKKNVKMSEDFWRKLCTGLDLEEDSPIRVLRDKLILDRISKSSLPARERYAIIIKAWNHYRKGNSVKVIRWNKNSEAFPEIV